MDVAKVWQKTIYSFFPPRVRKGTMLQVMLIPIMSSLTIHYVTTSLT